jgi:hypothetical protein
MKVDEAYDLIVIGDQLSGLFLAAGAAQQGMKVLVLEESDFPTVLYEAPSGRLLADFIAEPLIGLEQGSKVDEFLRSLSLYQDLESLFPLHNPPVQLVSNGFRLDFSYDETTLAAAVKREFQLPPEGTAALARLLAGSVVSKKNFSALVSELGLPVTFEVFGKLQAALYGSLLPDQLPYGDYREILAKGRQGVRFPVGGRGALKERLLSRLQLFGGSLRRASHVEEVVFERKRLSGVLLSSYEGFVSSHRVVGAMAAGYLARLLPAELRPRRLNELVAAVRPRSWKLGFTLLVPEAVIPEGLGSHVALFDPDAGFEGSGFLQLQVFPKDMYGGIPSKHRVILGRMLIPFEESAITPRSISTHLKRALARIEKLIPFLREQDFAFFPDPDNLEKDPVYQRYYKFKSIEHIPGSLLIYEHGFGDAHEPAANLDWSSFGLEGVALCSRDIRPLHGLLGEVLTAIDLLAAWKGARRKP